MKTSQPFLRTWRSAFLLGLLLVAARTFAVALPGAFVEPLPGFIPVDARADNSSSTPTSGITYVLGRNDSNEALLRKYDSAGAELTFDNGGTGTNQVILSGVTPTALVVVPGTTNLYVVGGDTVMKVSAVSGAALVTRDANSAALNLKSVVYANGLLYVAGDYNSSSGSTLFGKTVTARGNQAGILIKFTSDLPATATALVTFGGTQAGTLNTANSVTLDDNGDVYVGGHLGYGTFSSEVFTSGQFNNLYRHRTSGINNLQDAQAVVNGDYTDSATGQRSDMCGIGSSSDNGDHNYIWRESGFYKAPTAGQYSFRSFTDDGSWVYVDGQQVVYDNTTHGQNSHTGTISLFAGIHQIEWLYFNSGGPGAGSLYVTPAGVAESCVTAASFDGNQNQGYVLKFSAAMDTLLSAYFNNASGNANGGDITELTYNQGWVYAIGNWRGTNAFNSDLSSASSTDIEVLKLDTGLQLKKRAAIKGVAENFGYSLTPDDSGDVYLTGSFGPQSADFFGSADATNSPFYSVSSSKLNFFAAKLNSDFNFEWVDKPTGTPPNFSTNAPPRIRWNTGLQRMFWVGYFNSGTLVMGNTNNLQTLNGPEGFVSVIDPGGPFTERVNLTIASTYGQSGTQIQPFGGPGLDTNTVVNAANTKPVIKGAQITVSVPRYLYRDLNNNDITTQISQDDSLAETRIGCTGYSVDNNVANGTANSYTFTLSKDTIVTFGWLVEHALRIKDDFSATAGSDSVNAPGHIIGLTSEAAGTPVPAVNKHWIAENEPVIAAVDSYVDDFGFVSQGLPVRYVVTGYDAFGPPNTLTGSGNTAFIPFLGNDIRRQVPQFLMTGPATITYHWKLKIGVQVTTSGYQSAGFPLVHVLSDPGQVIPPTQGDGVGSGTFYYDENTSLQIGSLRAQDTTQLKGWFNGDGTIFPTSGSASNLTGTFSITNGGSSQAYLSQPVAQLKRPARVLWDYGDRIFQETVDIGNSVTFSTVDDPAVFAKLSTNVPPAHVDIVTGPSGSGGGDMAEWDPAGKRFYPLRPGEVYSYWYTTANPDDRVIIRLDFKYPASPHYRHIANTPGVLLDVATNDLVKFKSLKYTETTTGAAVDADGKFTATGPGKSVLLFTEVSSSGRGGTIENYRVRVVDTRNWSDQLPGTQNAVIGTKITSPYDTAGLGSGYVYFPSARYNAAIYNREAASGPIIPVNLNPTATTEEQLVVVWYEQRDQILWPYQSVRYQPVWPTSGNGLGRIVIASRYGNESVAADGTDQVVVPQETYGTNTYPPEYALDPARFAQVQLYNQPNRALPGFNPNEEHALLAPSLRSADISPRPMAVYALRDGDLNATNKDATYTSDPYVLVQFYDLAAGEYRMKVYNIVRAATNLNVGDLSYKYSFEQEMTAGEPVVPFYPLPQVIGATPCPGSYGRDGQPTTLRCYWKDHKGTAWAVSGDSFFYGYYYYPLLPDFYWPPTDAKNPGDCVAFLPNTPRYSSPFFAGVDYTRNDQVPAAQGIYYSTVWPQDVPILKVGETLTFAGGEYRSDVPTTTVTTDDGDVITKPTEGLPGVVGFAAGEIVFDSLNPVMSDQLNFTKYTARIFPALEERTVSLPVNQFPDALLPANKRSTVKNGVYVFSELPSSLQKRIFYDPLRGKLGIKGFLNDKDISDSTLTAAPGAVYVLEPNVLTSAERAILNGSASQSPFQDLAGTPFASAMDALFNFTRNPNQLDQGGNGVDTAYRVGLEPEIVRDPATGQAVTANVGGIISVQRDATKASSMQALGPGLALVANPAFLDPNNPVQISYVTLAENNSDALGSAPVAIHIIKVDKTKRYRGAIKTILSDNVFDENIILRHTGDFGGNADDLVFEWWYRAEDGTEAKVPDRQPSPTPWKLFADPTGNAGQGFYQLTLKGNPSAPEVLLGDTLFFVRYRHKNEVISGVNWEVPQPNGERRCVLNNCIPGIPYDWAGAGNSSILDVDGDGEPDYKAQLAEGWIKRVLDRINIYEARINDFTADNPATYSSIIQQLGQGYTGPVALNPAQNVIENVGLIALYETIFKRGKDLSIDLSTPISTPSIANALQLASTRLSDFYTLLGNEAYSDAQNPTIGYGSDSVEYGDLAPSVFAFQNQEPSLIEENLALLRGVDDNNGAPVYNRLYWNFSHAEGEAAYAMNYNITDVNSDGFIDAQDAAILYPQGHGDAWGHYLSALTFQYDLLRHPYFNWVSRSEFINSQDVVIPVDYLDERKFAQVAAAKAQAGAEIVNMTYREKFVADPHGQWQGYTDTDKLRSWGVEEWSRRAAQGCYFDWLTANALLPAVHPNTNYTGIQKVDRTTVQDIAVIAANLNAIQATVEQVDAGKNPLGLATDGLAFDLDPSDSSTLFEQLYSRAAQALDNSKTTFDYANNYNNLIRQVANSTDAFRKDVYEQDLAYRNQLIEIYGTPYEGTIGSGQIYPAGYQGPDTQLYMYVAVNKVNDSTVPQANQAYFDSYAAEVTGSQAHFVNGVGVIPGVSSDMINRYGLTFISTNNVVNSINYTDFSDTNANPVVNYLNNFSLPVKADGYSFVAPDSWGQRASAGELQQLISQLVQTEADLNLAIGNWDGAQSSFIQSLQLLNATFDKNKYQTDLLKGKIAFDVTLETAKAAFEIAAKVAEEAAGDAKDALKAGSDMVPTDLPEGGLSISPGDALAPVRGGVEEGGVAAEAVGQSIQIPLEALAAAADVSKNLGDAIFDLQSDGADRNYDMIQMLQEAQNNSGNEASARVNVFKVVQQLRDLSDQYRTKVAEGKRLIEQRTAFNKRVAAQTQQNRYQDYTFRVARNAALEKYRSSFDLASRYAYLAGTAYDYDTNLRLDDSGSPVSILGDIVREQTLGLINGTISAQPQVGAGGLAEDLAKLRDNYGVLKTRLGINNPQNENAAFSLRSEAFRILNTTNGDTTWASMLRSANIYKNDLWQVPEFRRYCRPFDSASNGPQPGLVIPFSTQIQPGKNFFGWPLGGGDSSYDPSLFATRITSVGVAFAAYDTVNLPRTPRVYLVPAGSDVMTVPTSAERDVRLWNVAEQTVPVPYPSVSASLSDPTWRPLTDSLNGSFGDTKQISSFRAYGFDHVPLNDSDLATITYDTRLVGRSAWNTRWLLIIPGATLGSNPTNALDTFINSVKDISLNINTHGYSGN